MIMKCSGCGKYLGMFGGEDICFVEEVFYLCQQCEQDRLKLKLVQEVKSAIKAEDIPALFGGCFYDK